MGFSNHLSAKIGARAENSTVLNSWNFAPRLALAYRLDENWTSSVAYGIFYQNPESRYFNAEAQKYLDQAKKLEKENAENYILQKMIHGMKMMVNPMSRYMTEGMEAQEALKKAESLDAKNPRITILRAEALYFTPEQFGGSKEKGIEHFKKALEQFKTYKPKSELHPN